MREFFEEFRLLVIDVVLVLSRKLERNTADSSNGANLVHRQDFNETNSTNKEKAEHTIFPET